MAAGASVFAAATPEGFDSASALFRLEPLFPGSGLRLGRSPFPGFATRLLDEREEPFASGFAISGLRAMRAAVDQQIVVSCEAPGGKRPQAILHRIGKRGGPNIEPQLYGRGNFVDVLAAGTGRTNEAFFDVAFEVWNHKRL